MFCFCGGRCYFLYLTFSLGYLLDGSMMLDAGTSLMNYVLQLHLFDLLYCYYYHELNFIDHQILLDSFIRFYCHFVLMLYSGHFVLTSHNCSLLSVVTHQSYYDCLTRRTSIVTCSYHFVQHTDFYYAN